MRRRFKHIWLAAPLALAVFATLAAGPCVEHRALENGLAGFMVTVKQASGPASGSGTAADPYAYTSGDVTLTFDAEAFDQHGMVMEDFEGEVALRITPGELAFPGDVVAFSHGRVQDATVRVRKVFGRVNLWLEDVRWVSGTDEHIGVYIFGGPEPDEYYDLHHAEGTWATGTSNTVHFADPTLRQVQKDDWLENIDYSSLAGNFVEVECHRDEDGDGTVEEDEHGWLVVTGVYSEGFYVTDVTDAGHGYNHLYAYNYSYPEGLEVGYRLDRLIGTATDFSGCTQVGFPAWTAAMNADKDPEPFRVQDLDALIPPAPITRAVCDEEASASTEHLCGHSKYNWVMEALESARVRLENVRAPDVLVNCDFNSNLEIPFTDPEGSAAKEVTCRDACLERDGQTAIIAREVVADNAVLRELTTSPCTSDSDCASGKCGMFDDEAGPDYSGICRLTCPWQASIETIRPYCIELRISDDHVCTELSTMRQYGQWVVSLDDGQGPMINVLSQEALVNYDPEAPENLGRSIPFLQGNLQQVRAARPRWIVLIGMLPADVPDEMKP
ncbi:MAG: hypothetical protein JXR96_21520 [Deltaproteobacteria bacterium]|nr:hypothetical protein [Deltaproteobacteria bacterium]